MKVAPSKSKFFTIANLVVPKLSDCISSSNAYETSGHDCAAHIDAPMPDKFQLNTTFVLYPLLRKIRLISADH
jgi:hypothetical protein